MDSVWNHSATGEWKFIPIKRGNNGVGKVTGEYASQIIEQAENEWLGQLSDEQIAFGIALMNVESGFNPNAAYSGPLPSHAFGLGQFQPGTWEAEVAKYNQNNTDNIDPVADKWNAGAQIKILGQWIDDTLWPRAEAFMADPSFSSYSLYDIAYGIHHSWNKTDTKTFLDGAYKKEYLDKWINNVTRDVNKYFNGVEFDFYYNNACWAMPYNSAWSNFLNPLRSLFTTASSAAVPRRDPLILDLDRDGTETIGVEAGAYFDHDANGFAEQTGWVSPDDGLLVRDINNDGIINNGRELFGDNTILKSGSLATDGLQALADLDSNGDKKIDTNDSAFSQLKVWKDANSDGISQLSELKTLSELNIKSLNTTYTTTNITDPSGNIQTHAATYEKLDGSIGLMGNFLVQRDTGDTRPTETLPVPEGDISTLPDMQGYGNVYDLQQIITKNIREVEYV